MSVELPIVRASSMPLAVSCPASISGAGVQVDSYDPTAVDGTEVHRAIALSLVGKEAPPFSGINAGENEDMLALALVYAERNEIIGKDGLQVEVPLKAPPFSATLDVMFVDAGPAAIVVDWKTTYREDDHEAQILAQCACLFAKYPHVQKIVAHLVYLRNEGAVRKQYSREWVEHWREEYIHNNLNHPEIYRPGDWCSRCKRKIECPALRAQMAQTVAVLADRDFEKQMLKREMVADMRTRVSLLKEAIALFDDYVRHEVIQNGPIPLGNGKELRTLDINKEKIDLRKSWETLTKQFADEELSQFIQVHKTPMVKLIEAGAPRGGKSKASEAFMEKLRKLGAVTTTVEQQVRALNVREP